MSKDIQWALRVSESWLALVDQLRRLEPDLPSRPEMVRRIVERAASDAVAKGFIPQLEVAE